MKISAKWSIPTWALVATGLLLNVLSALMTNFVIDSANIESSLLRQRQESNDKLITLIWQQVQTVERKRELLLVLANTSSLNDKPIAPVVARQLRDDLSHWLGDQDIPSLNTASIEEMMRAIDAVQFELREQINELYIENIEFTERHTNQTEYVSRLRNLALFLQIIGLALILSRDLRRRDYQIS